MRSATAGRVCRYEQFAWHYDQLTAGLYRPGEAAFYSRLAGAGPVFEPACGAGRMLAVAQAAGSEVWGTDRSQAMLGLAAARLAPAPAHHLRQADVAELVDGPGFGLVMLPLEAFRLLPDGPAQRRFLAGVRRILKPGGRLALDVTLPEAIFPAQLQAETVTGPDGAVVTATTRWVRRDGQTIERTAFEIREAGARPRQVCCDDAFRDISAPELEALLAATGWRPVVWDSDFRGTPYRPGAAQLVVVAEVVQ